MYDVVFVCATKCLASSIVFSFAEVETHNSFGVLSDVIGDSCVVAPRDFVGDCSIKYEVVPPVNEIEVKGLTVISGACEDFLLVDLARDGVHEDGKGSVNTAVVPVVEACSETIGAVVIEREMRRMVMFSLLNLGWLNTQFQVADLSMVAGSSVSEVNDPEEGSVDVMPTTLDDDVFRASVCLALVLTT